ncbi:glycoside hydrolase family 3 N-terminal domain-containing protein [Microlunatus panaciterrae]|uniref:beta-glucosidase n=1 Tax=Microlunatus panaciterrae TaxID=400768 RepID=A0ABS2RH12_9ACTN|nr:glycoside hydrolase family 3 protein [Microlunatus panaciterrae]MBM7798295.1 beta-glucosidase [Microlunatus panaciterrae]
MEPTYALTEDGIRYRDLNGNGRLDPYENPDLPVEERVEDLLSQMTVADKAGMMFQNSIETGPDGQLVEGAGVIDRTGTSELVRDRRMNHFNVHALPDPAAAARWSNALQRLAESTPLGIPVTLSTDPRHAFTQNAGASFMAGHFSQWPEPLGLAAIGDVALVRRFADTARQEYLAVGIRAALHPTVDLATEPRWARQFHTFGQDAELVAALAAAYLQGFQGDTLTSDSVACTTKHFPGGGPQADGEDAHFPYGKDQVYPGGIFDYHLIPFRKAIGERTAAIMPYYGRPVGLEIDGEPIEEVGFGFNRQIISGLLRTALGYDGVVVTDWGLVSDTEVGDRVLPARAWGVEDLTPAGRMLKILDAGCDQFGGESCPELLLQLVASSDVAEQRLDESVRRLLRVKFELGLFDNPYVDEDRASAVLGSAPFAQLGHDAQVAAITGLKTTAGVLPLTSATKVYAEGVDPATLEQFATSVATPDEAEVILVRSATPFDFRDSLFLEAFFKAGTLEFADAEVAHLQELAGKAPLILDLYLDRPAILTPLLESAAVITANFGASDRALLEVLSGRQRAVGRLQFELPSSMEAVRRSRSDVGSDTDAPVYGVGHRVELM